MFELKHKYEDIFSGRGGARAANEAAAAQAAGNQQAIDEIRRQFDVTQGQLTPFIEAGQAQLPALQRGATPGGLDEIIGQILNTDVFGNLAQERGRAVQGQLAAGGLTRSGTGLQEAARVPTDLALQIESLLSGRQQSLAGQAQSGAVNLGEIGAGASGNIAKLLSRTGKAEAQGILTGQQARAAGGQNLLNTAATVASIFFSDPSLKENVEKIGELGDLKIYQWDWIEKTKGTLIEHCSNIGFMANQVKEQFPQFVHDFCGFMVIDYDSLLNELQEAA